MLHYIDYIYKKRKLPRTKAISASIILLNINKLITTTCIRHAFTKCILITWDFYFGGSTSQATIFSFRSASFTCTITGSTHIWFLFLKLSYCTILNQTSASDSFLEWIFHWSYRASKTKFWAKSFAFNASWVTINTICWIPKLISLTWLYTLPKISFNLRINYFCFVSTFQTVMIASTNTFLTTFMTLFAKSISRIPIF